MTQWVTLLPVTPVFHVSTWFESWLFHFQSSSQEKQWRVAQKLGPLPLPGRLVFQAPTLAVATLSSELERGDQCLFLFLRNSAVQINLKQKEAVPLFRHFAWLFPELYPVFCLQFLTSTKQTQTQLSHILCHFITRRIFFSRFQ